ncbi:16119_t:CDS:2 [Entrophospora sp. SA101]|nr:16119_t:CDS:2 [Entrophospora sp. SA101]
MLILPGNLVLSSFKSSQLLKNIQTKFPSIDSITAIHVHFIQPSNEASFKTLSNTESIERKILDNLLNYGIISKQEFSDDADIIKKRVDYMKSCLRSPDRAANDSLFFIVIPRPGTISPWSSKATDIAYMCNLKEHVVRIERGVAYWLSTGEDIDIRNVISEQLFMIDHYLHDRMTQTLVKQLPTSNVIFKNGKYMPLKILNLVDENNFTNVNYSLIKEKFVKGNKEIGLALSDDEMDYLIDAFIGTGKKNNDNITSTSCLFRNPTEAELFMFAQVNSEHCRHKIFNAEWKIDGEKKSLSLFDMIRNTHKLNPDRTLSAYSDNAAVLEGFKATRFSPDQNEEFEYSLSQENVHIVAKVETHNHPTAVSPFPGASTGSGGEIRDEGSVGQGSKPKAGLTGYSVSNLLIPGYVLPWEIDFGKPSHIASALNIIIEAPLGGAAFNNEFGRPNITGYFRTFAQEIPKVSNDNGDIDILVNEKEIRGYHKPIMIAGGLGNIRPMHIHKKRIVPGTHLFVLGGPSMLIGIGGGTASSLISGSSSAELDFASVQRENPEMQRRCQQVIDSCASLGEKSPIQSIHDVGAGGLSNAVPEIVHDSELGCIIRLRDIPNDDPGMSPMEIWCNEAQERYVLAISPENTNLFESICRRERCPYANIGVATKEQKLIVEDSLFNNEPINLPMSILFGNLPKISFKTRKIITQFSPFDTSLKSYISDTSLQNDLIADAINRVLRLPTVASKSFLITIGDRSITGLVAREQMVGAWQIPVADVAVTISSYDTEVITGEAMAMGERPPVALISAAASAKMAVAEAITNLAAANITSISHIRLSANWMCAANHEGEGARLYEAVNAIGMDLCPALGISIPVGKDSMSMKMKWSDHIDNGICKEVTSPLSLNITGFAPVINVHKTLTPQLHYDAQENTILVYFDLAMGKQRMGGSAIAQVYQQIGAEAPDVESTQIIKSFFEGIQKVRQNDQELVLAYHDRSDGGLFVTVVEMAFAGHLGVKLDISDIVKNGDVIRSLFNEELGAVIQIRKQDLEKIIEIFTKSNFPKNHIYCVGSVSNDQDVIIKFQSSIIYKSTRMELQRIWSETSFQIQSLRDNSICAKEEFDNILDVNNPGLHFHLTFDPAEDVTLPFVKSPTTLKPKIAILREQGVNGHMEMAFAFYLAGFKPIDVHMSDMLSGKVALKDFKGIVACGGFSYGDVLGAGSGWAKSILLHPNVKKEFENFFKERNDTFTLGICNGCQFLSQLKEIIPGTEDWPIFKRNRSEQFEARFSLVEITSRMEGSRFPIAVAHSEGRAEFLNEQQQISNLFSKNLVAIRFIDNYGKPTERYPYNPNGSPAGITGIQTPDGRVLAMMPHPERVIIKEANSWYPKEANNWGEFGPWLRMFRNARNLQTSLDIQ